MVGDLESAGVMNLSSFVISLIRTFAAIAVGAVLAWLAGRGLNLDDSIRQPVTEVLIALITAGWYLLVRTLEHLPQPYGRVFGYLLGIPAKPDYRS